MPRTKAWLRGLKRVSQSRGMAEMGELGAARSRTGYALLDLVDKQAARPRIIRFHRVGKQSKGRDNLTQCSFRSGWCLFPLGNSRLASFSYPRQQGHRPAGKLLRDPGAGALGNAYQHPCVPATWQREAVP